MSKLYLEPTLAHLQKLVSFNSCNPPREICCDSEIFQYLQQNLPGFEYEFFDAGDGCIALLATRGKPDLLFNFHIDTVPVATDWQRDPFQLLITHDKAVGLGACDIKGAAACMLTAVTQVDGDVALLFSSDEEFGSSAAIRLFLSTHHGFERVIVAEPTQAKAVLAHRGIQSAKARFSGISGHASEARALHDSAVHKATRWANTALNWVEQNDFRFENLHGLPFNIGKVEGGVKANMIAADCEMAFGFRPLPGQDAAQLLQHFGSLAEQTHCRIEAGFCGPTLPAANRPFEASIAKASKLATACNLPLGEAVNFWTEASLFSQAGLTALVYGPGDIAQAHSAGEWVALSQLQQVVESYIAILSQSHVCE